MHKFTFVLTALLLSASMSMAQLKVPARQISVYTNTLGTIGQVTNAQSPEDTIQAYIEWMDDNWGSSPDLEAILLDGQNAGGNSATNLGTVQAVTGLFDVVDIGDATIDTLNGDVTFNGSIITTNNDMALSYMGYPKITLTTDMLTSTISGGDGIPIVSFAEAFDNNRTSGTLFGTVGNLSYHTYEVDLGANHQGYLSMRVSASAIVRTDHGLYAQLRYRHSGVGNQTTIESGGNDRGWGVWVPASGLWTNQSSIIRYVEGRYVSLYLISSSLANPAYYKIHDFSFYGVTNGYRNAGGF